MARRASKMKRESAPAPRSSDAVQDTLGIVASTSAVLLGAAITAERAAAESQIARFEAPAGVEEISSVTARSDAEPAADQPARLAAGTADPVVPAKAPPAADHATAVAPTWVHDGLAAIQAVAPQEPSPEPGSEAAPSNILTTGALPFGAGSALPAIVPQAPDALAAWVTPAPAAGAGSLSAPAETVHSVLPQPLGHPLNADVALAVEPVRPVLDMARPALESASPIAPDALSPPLALFDQANQAIVGSAQTALATAVDVAQAVTQVGVAVSETISAVAFDIPNTITADLAPLPLLAPAAYASAEGLLAAGETIAVALTTLVPPAPPIDVAPLTLPATALGAVLDKPGDDIAEAALNPGAILANAVADAFDGFGSATLGLDSLDSTAAPAIGLIGLSYADILDPHDVGVPMGSLLPGLG